MSALAVILFVLVTASAVGSVADLPIEVGVDLPGTSHTTATSVAFADNSLVIAVIRDDRIFFGRNQVEPQSLSNAIRDRLSYGAERKAYIWADKRAHYGAVKNALDGVCTAGIEQVAFLVDGPARSHRETLYRATPPGSYCSANANSADPAGITTYCLPPTWNVTAVE